MGTYTKNEEIANVITHAAGAVLGIIGFVLLLLATLKSGNTLLILGGIVYTISLVMMFSASSIYHASTRPRLRFKLQKWDHISIFFLIAGSYTPFLLFYYLETEKGLIYVILIWAIAIIGTLYRLFTRKMNKFVYSGFYLAMGWMAILIGKPFLEVFPKNILWLIVWGGIVYSLGVIFYLWKKLIFNHAIWHVFVLVAAAIHFVAIYRLLS